MLIFDWLLFNRFEIASGGIVYFSLLALCAPSAVATSFTFGCFFVPASFSAYVQVRHVRGGVQNLQRMWMYLQRGATGWLEQTGKTSIALSPLGRRLQRDQIRPRSGPRQNVRATNVLTLR